MSFFYSSTLYTGTAGMHHTALLVAASALRSYASSPSCCDKVRDSELVVCCPRASSVSPLCCLQACKVFRQLAVPAPVESLSPAME